MVDQPSETLRNKRPFIGRTLSGVPLNRIDIEYAAELISALYIAQYQGPLGPLAALLEYNEKVVSRCGMLMGFSGLLIAVSLFIAANPKFLPTIWQQYTFYIVMFVWLIAILRLLWSLRHVMPDPWDFGTQKDFESTVRLFLYRMGTYNIALYISIVCFTLILLLLAPFSATLSDKIFSAGR